MNERIVPYDAELAKSITSCGKARIAELVAQAEKLTDFIHLDTVMNGDRSDWLSIFREKYAELIIKDVCSSVVQPYMTRFPEDCLLVLAIKGHYNIE